MTAHVLVLAAAIGGPAAASHDRAELVKFAKELVAAEHARAAARRKALDDRDRRLAPVPVRPR